jgi:hypothetical protein
MEFAGRGERRELRRPVRPGRQAVEWGVDASARVRNLATPRSGGVPGVSRRVVLAAPHDPKVGAEQLHDDLRHHVVEPLVPASLDAADLHLTSTVPARSPWAGPRPSPVSPVGRSSWTPTGPPRPLEEARCRPRSPPRSTAPPPTAARWIAKHVAAAGLARRALVRLRTRSGCRIRCLHCRDVWNREPAAIGPRGGREGVLRTHPARLRGGPRSPQADLLPDRQLRPFRQVRRRLRLGATGPGRGPPAQRAASTKQGSIPSALKAMTPNRAILPSRTSY